MGVLTDFVIADASEAQQVGKSLCPSRDFNGLDAKGMDQVKLGKLYALLTGSAYDPNFMTTEESFLYGRSEDGPWVQLVPHDLVSRVAQLNDGERGRIAEEWSKSKAFDPKCFGWPPDAVKEFFEEFAALCRRAVAERKAVLMWMCL